MIPLVEFPELVQRYAHFFKEVVSPEALIEFERYISGLIVSENKTVDGINRLFILESRNQSSLNRLLTESPYSLDALNDHRLRLLAILPGTRGHPGRQHPAQSRQSRLEDQRSPEVARLLVGGLATTAEKPPRNPGTV